MEFQQDIFISYAHNDDHALTDDEKGWISNFHNTLKVMVMEKLGVEPKIWRDNSLQGNDYFTPEIEQNFQKSKVMVSVITPRYIQSGWCKKEVTEFFRAADLNGGVKIENKARIFKVIKTRVNYDSLPEVIKPILAYEFYTIDENGRPKEFNKIFGPQMEQLYFSKLNDLAWDIVSLIEVMDAKGTQEINISSTIKGNSNGRTIYLAETSYDLKDNRDNIKRELESNGFIVLPNKVIENFEEVYKNEVAAFLEDCTLSIHLIGSTYGSIPDGSTDKRSIIEIQNDLAASKSKANGLRRLIWVPLPLKPIEDPQLIDFIDRLKHKEDLQNGSDLLAGNLEDFKFAIFDTIRKLDVADKEKREKDAEIEKAKADAESAKSAATAAIASINDDEQKTVFIICDERDKDSSNEIRKFLKSSGLYVDRMSFDGNDEEKRNAYNASMRDCDAVVIYYGQGSESWLKAKIGEVRRKPTLPEARKLKVAMIYKGEPSTALKSDYDDAPPGFLVEGGSSGFKEDSFDDFIKKLK